MKTSIHKPKLYFNEWWELLDVSAIELERQGVVSRKTIGNIRKTGKFQRHILKKISLAVGMKYEDWFRRPEPAKPSPYTLRTWLADPQALLDTNLQATPEQQMALRGVIDTWLREEQRKKDAASIRRVRGVRRHYGK